MEDRLTAKSWNRENLLEGTSVACQIIGFGDQNSAQTLGDACGGQDTFPLQVYLCHQGKASRFYSKFTFEGCNYGRDGVFANHLEL